MLVERVLERGRNVIGMVMGAVIMSVIVIVTGVVVLIVAVRHDVFWVEERYYAGKREKGVWEREQGSLRSLVLAGLVRGNLANKGPTQALEWKMMDTHFAQNK